MVSLVLNFEMFSVGTGLTLLNAQMFIKKSAKYLSQPLLLLHGGQDRLVDPKGSKEFFNEVQIQDKNHIIYESHSINSIFLIVFRWRAHFYV